ncbi:MAG TPA: DMT family transporter [Chondromyces sp.]|nr:DMT family transporter [Chondromyces sp.]
MNSLRYSLFVLIGACSYGINGSMIKLTTAAGYSPAETIGSQYFTGLILLFTLLLFSRRVKMRFTQVLSLAGVGVLLSVTGVLYAVSIDQLTASFAVVMLFQFTWIGILIEALYQRKMPSRIKLISVLLLWIGTLLAGGTGTGGIHIGEAWKGILAGLLSAITFALFIFFSGKAGRGIPTIQRSTVITFGGLLTTFLFTSPAFIVDGTLEGGLWKYGLLVGLFGVIFPIVFFAIGTPHIDSGTATIVGAAELPAAIIAAMLIAGEHVTPLQTAGILLIIIGIAVPQWKYTARRPKKSYSG